MHLDIVITCSRVWINRYGCQSCSWSAGQKNRNFPVSKTVCSPAMWFVFLHLFPSKKLIFYPVLCGTHFLMYLFKPRHTPSGQSRVHRVTQLRTDGVHCRESAGTGIAFYRYSGTSAENYEPRGGQHYLLNTMNSMDVHYIPILLQY